MKILVTGGTGMLGQCFLRLNTDDELILVGSKNYNLTLFEDAWWMIKSHKPDAIIHLAARVGGVKGNTDFVADFYCDNILINTNVLEAARMHGIEKVISLLSTCVYPGYVAEYPLTPDQIHSGPPHKSNFGYAYAKRMLDVHSRALRQQHGLCYTTAIPNNLYGLNDNFDLENGHVIPAIIRKVWEAKNGGPKVILWGSGNPLREFTFSDDIARILLFLVKNYDDEPPLNIGKTTEYSISAVTRIICKTLDYDFSLIKWDKTKPEGQFRKPSSNEQFLQLFPDFEYTPLADGLQKTCDWFAKEYPNVRGV